MTALAWCALAIAVGLLVLAEIRRSSAVRGSRLVSATIRPPRPFQPPPTRQSHPTVANETGGCQRLDPKTIRACAAALGASGDYYLERGEEWLLQHFELWQPPPPLKDGEHG
jgi:hypothetical protein